MELTDIFNLFNNPSFSLGILGIIIPLIPMFNKKVRLRIRKIFKKLLLRIHEDNLGINATYLKNYDRPPITNMDDSLFQKIKSEVTDDNLERITIHPRYLKIKSIKLGMKLFVSVEQEYVNIVDEEYEQIPYNVTVKMDADIKGSSQIHNINNFIIISEKIHEIIRAEIFGSGVDLKQSYVLCTINNVENTIDNNSKKSFEYEDNKITIKKDSTTILSHTPTNLTKILKKYVYA